MLLKAPGTLGEAGFSGRPWGSRAGPTGPGPSCGPPFFFAYHDRTGRLGLGVRRELCTEPPLESLQAGGSSSAH